MLRELESFLEYFEKPLENPIFWVFVRCGLTHSIRPRKSRSRAIQRFESANNVVSCADDVLLQPAGTHLGGIMANIAIEAPPVV